MMVTGFFTGPLFISISDCWAKMFDVPSNNRAMIGQIFMAETPMANASLDLRYEAL
jgi:hypothetical protein